MSEYRELQLRETATVVPVQGAVVGLIPCVVCGAAILLDPRDATDRVDQHAIYHERRGDV